MSLTLIFLVIALILFILTGVGVPVGNLNLIAFGLPFWVLAELVGHVALR